MNRDLASTLKATGFVSHDQLSHHFVINGSMPRLEPWMIQTSDGIWATERFQRGRHIAHWTLQTAVYLRLADEIDSWSCDQQEDLLAQPDAVINVKNGQHPVALEADTGKENGKQWQVKLQRYQTTPDNWRILVVAQGKQLRLQHITEWLTQYAPRHWLLVPADKLDDPQWDWNWTEPMLRAYNLPEPVATRMTVYLLDGKTLAPAQAELTLQSQQCHVLAYERRHGTDVVHLTRRRLLR